MDNPLSMVLVFSDVLLATGVFLVLARPDIAVGWVLRREGRDAVEDPDFSSLRELERLRRFSRFAGALGLGALACWSFLVGTILALMRL